MTAIYTLNSKAADPNVYIFSALVRALQGEVLQGRGGAIDAVHQVELDTLMAVPRTPDPCVLLVYGGEELGSSVQAERLCERFGLTAIWFTEDPYELGCNKAVAGAFDLVYTNDTGSCHAYFDVPRPDKSRHPAIHLPLGADPSFLPSPTRFPTDRLCFFSGTAWPNRKRVLGRVVAEIGSNASLDFHLVANPIVEASPFGSRGLPEGLTFSSPIPISEFCLRASRSLCTIVMGRDFSGSGNTSFARSPGPRLFEAGITGTCQLVHSEELPDLPEGIEEGKHVLRFRNEDELLGLLRNAQHKPEEFRVIGEEMRAAVLRSHTYQERAQRLLGDINEKIQSGRWRKISLNASARRRYLFLTHELAGPDFHHGGAGICLEEILKAVSSNADIRVLAQVGDKHQFELTNEKGTKIKAYRLKEPVEPGTLRHPELEGMIVDLLQDFRPHLVHINHLLGFSPSVVPLIRKSGAATIATLHDYYLVCDSWNLLDESHRFCGITKFSYERCEACTQKRWPQAPKPNQLRRRVAFAEALHSCNHIIVPSLTAGRLIQSVFGDLESLQVVEPVFERGGYQSGLGNRESKPLTVLICGNLSINKGYIDLQKIIDHVESLALPVLFRVQGRVDHWISKKLAASECVELHGRYEPHELSFLAREADLALFLSPWPETYCMSFDEVASTGLPVFFYEIGAVAEPHRRRDINPMSRSFAPGDVAGVLASLIEHLSPLRLAELRQSKAGKKSVQSPGRSFGEQHVQLFEKWSSEASFSLNTPSLCIAHTRVIKQPILQPDWLLDKEAHGAARMPTSWKRRLWDRSRDLLYSSRTGTRIVRWSRRWRS